MYALAAQMVNGRSDINYDLFKSDLGVDICKLAAALADFPAQPTDKAKAPKLYNNPSLYFYFFSSTKIKD